MPNELILNTFIDDTIDLAPPDLTRKSRKDMFDALGRNLPKIFDLLPEDKMGHVHYTRLISAVAHSTPERLDLLGKSAKHLVKFAPDGNFECAVKIITSAAQDPGKEETANLPRAQQIRGYYGHELLEQALKKLSKQKPNAADTKHVAKSEHPFDELMNMVLPAVANSASAKINSCKNDSR